MYASSKGRTSSEEIKGRKVKHPMHTSNDGLWGGVFETDVGNG